MMGTKRMVYPATLKALGDSDGQGRVEALVSVFGNVDIVGDRVVKGAFQKSIAKWQTSDDSVPAILSHDWGDPWKHIGVVEDLEETPAGLKATYTLDIDDNPLAKQVYKLLKRRSLKEHSFAYDVKRERTGKDGANELLELDIIEIGPTLKGANPDTELLAVKSAIEEQEGTEEPDVKAGRRLSKATEAKIDEAITILEAIKADGTTEDGKSQEPEEAPEVVAEADGNAEASPADGNGKATDDGLLSLKARIEAMRL